MTTTHLSLRWLKAGANGYVLKTAGACRDHRASNGRSSPERSALDPIILQKVISHIDGDTDLINDRTAQPPRVQVLGGLSRRANQ